MMKDSILLQTIISHGGIQDVNAKTQTYSEVLGVLKTFLNIYL